MRLYVVQHGEAKPKEVDPDRPLSAAGVAAMERLASVLRRRGIAVGRVLHSGKTRARQSAALLSEALPGDVEPEVWPGLKPADSASDTAPGLRALDGDSLLVSHLPLVARLVSLLVAGREDLDLVAFRPGTLVALELDDDGGARIAFMLPPDIVGGD
jgi:phosphohistidine phosphatase